MIYNVHLFVSMSNLRLRPSHSLMAWSGPDVHSTNLRYKPSRAGEVNDLAFYSSTTPLPVPQTHATLIREKGPLPTQSAFPYEDSYSLFKKSYQDGTFNKGRVPPDNMTRPLSYVTEHIHPNLSSQVNNFCTTCTLEWLEGSAYV